MLVAYGPHQNIRYCEVWSNPSFD